MRLIKKQASLLALVITFILLAVSLGDCSLAAYSETRSFRDALDGRSMEEALSGPVDKDTSSYGDRTAAASPVAANGANQGQMMLNIPANGNLNQSPIGNGAASRSGKQGPATEQQQLDTNNANAGDDSSELEREAEPIDPNLPSDNNQQQLMEQVMSARQKQKQQQQRAGSAPNSNGRDNKNSRLMPAMMMMTRMAMNGASQQQPQATRMSERSRQLESPTAAYEQQQQQQAKGTEGQANMGFGDTQMMEGTKKRQPGAKPPTAMLETNGYGGRQSGGAVDSDSSIKSTSDYGQQQTSTSSPVMNGPVDNYDQQQQQMSMANGDGKSGDYDGQRQNMQMMRSTQDNGAYGQQKGQSAMGQMNSDSMQMNYGPRNGAAASAGMGAQYGGDKSKQLGPSTMAQNMIMSLANKAAAAAKYQRQVAPQMMMNMANGRVSGGQTVAGSREIGAYSSTSSTASSQQQQAAPMMMIGNYMTNGAASPRAMRRANRRIEKKMSPVMMNAMLNKMFGSRDNGASAMSMEQNYSNGGQQMNGNSMVNNYANMNENGGSTSVPKMVMTMVKMNKQQRDSMISMLKSPAGAKMLGEMMQANGGSEEMTSAKMDQYKRSMMKLVSMAMQQQQQQQPSADSQMMSMNGMIGDNVQQQEMAPNGAGFSSGYDNNEQSPTMQRNGYGPSMRSGAQPSGMVPIEQQQDTKDTMSKMNRQSNYNRPKSMGSRKSSRSPMMSAGGMMKQTPEQAYGDSTNEAVEQQVQMTTPMSSRLQQQSMNYGRTDADDQQQREMATPPSSSMNNGYGQSLGNGQAASSMSMTDNSIMQPMNGMRQAYGSPKPMTSTMSTPTADQRQYDQEQQQQQQQQKIQNGLKSTGGSNNGDDYQKSDMQQNTNGAANYGDEQRQQQTNEYGDAAPAGQAEPFAFDYKIEDNYGNGQYRKEESDKNGVVRGSYGYMDTNGIYRHVEYVADENGFRANIKSNEPGLNGANDAQASNGANGAASRQTQQQSDRTQADSYGAQSPSSSSSLANEAPAADSQQRPMAQSNLMENNGMSQQQQPDEQQPVQTTSPMYSMASSSQVGQRNY